MRARVPAGIADTAVGDKGQLDRIAQVATNNMEFIVYSRNDGLLFRVLPSNGAPER
jgi:hypothetical protein